MKISSLIELLQDYQHHHGDVEVMLDTSRYINTGMAADHTYVAKMPNTLETLVVISVKKD